MMNYNFKINGNIVAKTYNNTNSQAISTPSFKGATQEKLLKKILATDNNKLLKLSFDEMVKIYEHLGYDVVLKRGSHAIIPVGKVNIPLVIPHKDKYVHPNDIKRLKYVIAGQPEKAKLV